MIDNAHVLDILFGKGNALWRKETRHESMLLMRALYKTDAGALEKISVAILQGPPPELLREEDNEEVDWHIFEMLSFLESEYPPLRPEAQQELSGIKERHPEWSPKPYPGMSMWIESGGTDKSVTIDDIKSVAPEDVPGKIITFEDGWKKTRRDFCEAIGALIAHDPGWGLQAIDALQINVKNLPMEAINPILWGIRATLTDNTIRIEMEGIVVLLNKFDSMIQSMPIPTMWTSLPSLLSHLVRKYELSTASWNELGVRLASMFEAFDYERSEEREPIEWHHRAINHPYGDLTELYLNLAQQHGNHLSRTEKPLSLEPQAEKFFSQMLANYNLGSRYGLCLLAQRLSWLEAVSREFAGVLLSVFDWAQGGERPIVAWTGYLWSNTLSRSLIENFELTYALAAQRHSNFGGQEQRALASHVSAVFWFHPDRVNLLYKFASAVDSDLRVALLRGWKNHLKNAQEESAKRFFDSILFPYWDWCARQDSFRIDNADKERFGFWELIPLSFASFPEACWRAHQRRPSTIDNLGLFVREAVNDSTLSYPNELTELLIALLELDFHPQWQEEDWRASLKALRSTGARRLNDLENALARKGISLDPNT